MSLMESRASQSPVTEADEIIPIMVQKEDVRASGIDVHFCGTELISISTTIHRPIGLAASANITSWFARNWCDLHFLASHISHAMKNEDCPGFRYGAYDLISIRRLFPAAESDRCPIETRCCVRRVNLSANQKMPIGVSSPTHLLRGTNLFGGLYGSRLRPAH
jgi:hypothetical protein